MWNVAFSARRRDWYLSVRTTGVGFSLLSSDDCLQKLWDDHTVQCNSSTSHHQAISWCQKCPVASEGLRAFEQCCQFLSNCLLSQLLPWTSVVSIPNIYSWSLFLQKYHALERDGSEAGSSSWKREAHVKPNSEEPGSIYTPLGISILLLWELPN